MLPIVIYIILISLFVLAAGVLGKPGIAIALAWSMIALESVLQQSNQFLVSNSSFVNFFIAGLVGVTIGWGIIRGKYRKLRIPIQFWLYLILITYCAISYFWSQSPIDTYDRFKLQLPYIITFCLLAPMCLINAKQLNTAITVLIYFGILIVIAINLSTIGLRGIIIDSVQGKAVEANPLAAASFSAYVGFASLFSIWGKKLWNFNSLLKLCFVGFCITAMYSSGSRGQVIAFAGISAIFLPLIAGVAAKRSTILAIVTIGIATFAVVIFIEQTELTTRWQYQKMLEDQIGRFDMLKEVMKHWISAGPTAWIFGIGSSSSFKYLNAYPHIVIGETLVEEGIFGLTLLIAIISVTFRQGFRLMSTPSLPSEVRVNIGIVFAIFTFNLLLSFKQGSLLGSASTVFCFALIIGWLHTRLLKKNQQPNSQHIASPQLPIHRPAPLDKRNST
jgi:hypothetical protein